MTGNCYLVLVMSDMGWKNLINPVSDASPVVGMSIYNLVLSSLYHLALYYLTFSYFYLSFNALLLVIAFTLSAGNDLSKFATEQITAL
jgi:hypothetical protein